MFLSSPWLLEYFVTLSIVVLEREFLWYLIYDQTFITEDNMLVLVQEIVFFLQLGSSFKQLQCDYFMYKFIRSGTGILVN